LIGAADEQMCRLRRGPRPRRGNITILAALALVVVLGMAAASIDYAVLAMARQQLQDAVDAAALAGAGALQYGIDQVGARQAITDTAAQNRVLGAPLTLATGDIQVGAWDEATRSVVPWSPAFTKAVARVTGRRTLDSANGQVPLFFSRIFGLNAVNLTATATAGVIVSTHPRRPVEICVVQDGSGSFEEEWADAINADWALFNLVNSVAMDGDRLSFVAFSDQLLLSSQYSWAYQNGRWVKVYKPLYKSMTGFGTSRTSLPSEWTTHKTLCLNTTPNGYTDPSVAFEWARNDYATNGDSTNHQQSIVLVSDGMPFGSTQTITNQRRANTVAKVNQLAALGVRIHTVTLTAEDYGTYGSGGADFEFN